MANHTSNVFRALIDCTLGVEGTWLAAVGDDLIWARKMFHRRSDLPVAASLKDWVRHAQATSALAWKLMLKHISKGYLTSRATKGPFERARAELNNLAAAMGLDNTLFSEPGAHPPAPPPLVDRRFISVLTHF